MKETIRAGRTELRPVGEKDKEKLLAMLMDERVSATYMVPPLDTAEARDALFRRFRELSVDESRFVYGIFLGDELIGMIHDVGVDDGTVELGYFIDPERQRRGYAREALSASIRALFAAGFSRVRAGAFEDNAASLRVMENCGMRRIDEEELVCYRGAEHRCVFREIAAPEGSRKNTEDVIGNEA